MRIFVIGLAFFLAGQTTVAAPVASLLQAAGLRARVQGDVQNRVGACTSVPE